LGVAYVPEYSGSDKTRVVPLPIFERTFDNGAFISSTRGVGFQTTLEGFGLSAALTYGGGRADHKKNAFYGSDALKGMGDIDGAVQAVLGVSYQVGTVGLSLSTTQNLAHREHGATYTIGASMPLYSTASDQVGLGLSAVYGDNKHMQTYYGVTAAQASRTAFKAYTAKAGFENLTAAVSWNHVIDKNWSAHSAVGVHPSAVRRRRRQPADQAQDHAYDDDRVQLQVLTLTGVSLPKIHIDAMLPLQ
jgi:outer membrane protein